MVVRSVIDEVDMSLGQLKVKMPEGAKLLFEILAAPDEGAVEFEYCFVLVRPVSNGILYKVERELVLSALLVEKNPQWKNCLCSCSPAIEAQVVYAIKNEMAVTADDIIWRRLGLGVVSCAAKHCRQEIENILKREWS